jgi:thiamine pyrophosphokinase
MAVRILGVLAGTDLSADEVVALAGRCEHVYAADSAADVCLAAGVKPIVVGDLDSIQSSLDGLDIRHDPDQNSTDADKMLAAIRTDHPQHQLLIAGLEGDRIDHVLSSLSSLMQHGEVIHLAFRQGWGLVVPPPAFFHDREIELPDLAGAEISVMPLGTAKVSLSGVEWPLEKADLKLGGLVSISNRALTTVQLTLHAGAVLIRIAGREWNWVRASS